MSQSKAPQRNRLLLIQCGGLLALTLVIAGAMQAVYGSYLTLANGEVMAMNFVFEAIVAVGMTLVIISGGIDLSVSSVFAFAEILVALLMVKFQLGIVSAIALTLLACVAIGALNGALIVLLQVHPLIITLGTMLALRGVNLSITGGKAVSGFSDGFLFLGQGKILGLNIPIMFLLFLTVVFGYLLDHQRFFRQLYFIGGNEQAASASGIAVPRVKIVVYCLSSLIVGCAGVLGAAKYGAAHWSHGNLIELKAIAAVAIGGANINGGTGTIWGTLLGSLFLAVIHNAFVVSAVNTFWYDVVNGAMLLLAVFLSKYIEQKNTLSLLKSKQSKLDMAEATGFQNPGLQNQGVNA